MRHISYSKAEELNEILQKDYLVKVDEETSYRYILYYNKKVLRRFFNINVLIEYYKELIEKNDQ